MSSKEIGSKAAAQASPKEETTVTERLNHFLRSNRRTLQVLGVAVIAIVVGLGVYSLVSSNVLAKSTLALEALEDGYKDFEALTETEKSSKGAELVAEADAIAAKYGKSYAAASAAMLKAQLLFAMNDLPGAEKTYAGVADAQPKSHLAPVALANAAAIAEDRGDSDAALAYLSRAEAAYPDAPGAGRLTLSIGRIYESTKRYDKAMESYSKLVAKGDESDWTKLAHDRIILLKSQGLAN
ncbi:MAG: tetratricopeptide repeat protein [Spirochaetes bacterium]|nr:tetratricopeptide repeat protein [Spirochaetota bacterium]MBU1081326.1 tetratricopeptide repeat protein [Spirochaetota bacterium]